jgi:hypothetical protein
MKKLTNRPHAMNALAKVNELHQAKRLFKKNGPVHDDHEVQTIVQDAIRELGLDIKEHAGIKTQAAISGEVLHNLMMIVRACSECACHYGVYDFHSGTSYYLGVTYPRICA